MRRLLLLGLLFCLPFTVQAKERIITLSPALTDIVYAVGAGDQIVATTAHTHYPKEAEKLPKVGDYFGVSLEKIVALSPTLVLLQRNNIGLVEKLRRLGIEAVPVRLGSLEEIMQAITEIGKRTGHDAEARKLRREIETSLQKVQGIVSGKKILIVFGTYAKLDKAIYAAGNNLYFADIIRASGNRNAVTSHFDKQSVLTYESLLVADPDIIYILTHQDDASPKTREKLLRPWRKLPVRAAKYGTIYCNTDPAATIPSQRIVTFIEDFRKILEDARTRFATLQRP